MITRASRWAFARAPIFRPPPDIDALAREVRVEHLNVAAVGDGPATPVDLYLPRASTSPVPCVVWMHGGGWMVGHRGLVRHLATTLAAHGVAVAAVGYALAPHWRHPVPVHQCAAVLHHLHHHGAPWGVDPTRLVLAGDSAGAQIAGEVAAAHVDVALAAALGSPATIPVAHLRGVVLCCGVYDTRGVAPGMGIYVRWLMSRYIGDGDRGLHRAQIAAVTRAGTGFPPTFITVGNLDPVRGQSYRLARLLRARGVRVTTHFPRGRAGASSHDYILYMHRPASAEGVRRLQAFLTDVTGSASPPSVP